MLRNSFDINDSLNPKEKLIHANETKLYLHLLNDFQNFRICHLIYLTTCPLLIF